MTIESALATLQRWKTTRLVLPNQDCNRLLKLAVGVEGRYGEIVMFRPRGREAVRAVGVLPSANSVFQHMNLFQRSELGDIEVPTEVVDLGSGAALKARRGELEFKAPGYLGNRQDRGQRGTHFFEKLFADIANAANTQTKSDQKKHPILFVDLTAWSGDSAAACPS
jgi:hypothetical protein